MSLKRNILANYASQLYVTLISILMVPLYVKYMGAEAYGLVGFFVMLQAWFQLLDLGLTPTMARETARFNGGVSDALSLRRLLRALEGIFIGIAVLGGTAMIVGSNAIATSWLKVQQLSLSEVEQSIMLMAVIIALRWVCGLYRGVINGFERLVWLSGFNIAVATARFVFILPVFLYISSSPTKFFAYQLVVAVAELGVLVVKAYCLLPKIKTDKTTPWEWKPLRGVLKFSLTIAFTSSVWVMVTQTDKLVLSKLLPLADYAYFTLAVLVASGVVIVSGPISAALLPRLTKLSAEDDHVGLIRLYRNATQLVGVIAIPAALMLATFAKNILWAWTGDAEIAYKAAPVLMLYALGNGVLAIGAFPYYLQFAKGDMRLHLIGNAIFLVILIPALIISTLRFGAVGAGYAWLIANIIYFLVWIPRIHEHFEKGLHKKWILIDVAPILLVALAATLMVDQVITWPEGRLAIAFVISGIGIFILTSASLASSWVRAWMFSLKIFSEKKL